MLDDFDGIGVSDCGLTDDKKLERFKQEVFYSVGIRPHVFQAQHNNAKKDKAIGFSFLEF